MCLLRLLSNFSQNGHGLCGFLGSAFAEDNKMAKLFEREERRERCCHTEVMTTLCPKYPDGHHPGWRLLCLRRQLIKCSHLPTMTTSASITPPTFHLLIRQTSCIFTGYRSRFWLIREYIARHCDVMCCDVMWHDVMWHNVMWHDVMWCDTMWRDATRCDMMWCDMIWCV